MSRFDRDARAIVAAYATPAARAHAAIRWASAPLARIESLLPRCGSVLDVGCGHGVFSLYAALRSSSRVVTGVDIDAAKIELGRRAVERLGVANRVTLTEVTAAWLPPADGFDAAVVNDVLYLLGRDRARVMIDAMIAAVRPGGVVIVKEIGERPRWKHRVNEWQELIATRVTHITAGDALDVLPEDFIERALPGAVCHRLDRGYPHAHAAWVARR